MQYFNIFFVFIFFKEHKMKFTKARLQKIINNKNNVQTRKCFKSNKKVLTHTNTNRNRKQINLKNNTLRNWSYYLSLPFTK